jgi:membrane peptidoglycan carboxypeptidase
VSESGHAACQPTCTLAQSTVASLNVPLYGLTQQLGAGKVIDMARAAGIEDMWGSTLDGKQERVDLRTTSGDDAARKYFGNEVGIGQYAVTVVDQANGMATFAADGVRARAHFVRSVRKDGKEVYAEKLPTTDAQRILNPNAIADLDHTLKQVPAGHLADGQDSASKTGTWQYASNLADSAHAWTVGYTNNLAVAVWTGNRAVERPLRLANGRPINGDTIAAPIYRDFVVKTTRAMGLKPAPFNPPAFIGDEGAGNTPPPKPKG